MAAEELADVEGGGFAVGFGEAVGDVFLGEEGFVPVLVHWVDVGFQAGEL